MRSSEGFFCFIPAAKYFTCNANGYGSKIGNNVMSMLFIDRKRIHISRQERI